MPDTHVMDQQRRRGVLLQTLLWGTLLGLCSASHRPYERRERTHHPRQHDRWTQRLSDPSLPDQGAQRVQYPSVNDPGTQGVHWPLVHDKGQTVQYPSFDDINSSSQIQVKPHMDVKMW